MTKHIRLSDAYLAASPTYYSAAGKGVRLLPIVPLHRGWSLGRLLREVLGT